MIDSLLMIFSISGIALTTVACSILLFSNKNHKYSNRLLSLLLIILGCVFLSVFLFEWNTNVYAYVYRLPSPLLYILFPTAYLYTRSIIHGDTKLYKKDILHFIPAAFYLIGILPLFFTTYAYRLSLVREIKNHPDQLIYLNDGMLPKYCNIALLLLQSIIYILLLLRLLNKDILIKKQKIQVTKTSAYNWSKVFAVSSAIIAMPMGLLFLSPEKFSAKALQLLLIVTILSFLIVHLFLFFKPRVLYGISQGEAVNISNDVLQNLPSYNTEKPIEQNCFPKPEARISNEKTFCDEFANLVYYRPKLEDYMSSAQPFLKQGYSIQDLSREINIPQHHLSALLNRVYKLRFTDYINGMRIRFIEENLGKPDWENLTLEGIAKQAGFTSRTTFFNAIKKTVGVTPSEFMAQLKKQQPKINSLL